MQPNPPIQARGPTDLAAQARFVQDRLPPDGLFADLHWRIAPAPFSLGSMLARELDSLGRVLLQFYRVANLLYRQSAAGKQPDWVARWLDQGKPAWLIELQRHAALKQELPRIIRPDLLLTEKGIRLTELDSVPGGIGLTAWLNLAYAELAGANANAAHPGAPGAPIGGARGMLDGFASIFGGAARVHIIVSEESSTYRPEMEWLVSQLDPARFAVRDPDFTDFQEDDAVYRFFELFDTANVPAAQKCFEDAAAGKIRLTPPPKPVFEEKSLLALLWNRNLRSFWHQHLGASFLDRMLDLVPYSWIVDPAPLPPHGAIPELNLTTWDQLKALSQRQRELILKISGFSEQAWGARGVHLGSDLSLEAWSAAVDRALADFPTSPWILQKYHKPSVVDALWFDPAADVVQSMPARVRLCPYYFVAGDGDQARAHLGGVLTTLCPADKKIIHGMKDAVLTATSS